MEDFASILHRDYGLKPQGKSAPMSAAVKSAVPPSPSASSVTGSISRSSSSGFPKNGSDRPSRSSTPILGESRADDLFFGGNGMRSSSGRSTFGSGGADPLAGGSGAYDDVFGGPPKFAPPPYSSQTPPAQNFDDIFRGMGKTTSSNKGSSLPVFDAPLYDDDIFGGVPGIRNANVVYDDVFSGGSTAGPSPAVFEDLLGGFGTGEPRERTTQGPVFDSGPPSTGESAFDELLPGFGGSEPVKSRSAGDGKPSQRKSPGPAATVASDPFSIFESTPAASSTSVSTVPDVDLFKNSTRSSGGNAGNDNINGVTDDTAVGNSSSSSPVAPFTANKSVNTTRESRRRREFAGPNPSPTTRINVSTESTDGGSGRRNHSNNDRVKDQTKMSPSAPKPEVQTKIPSSNLKREPDAPVSSGEAATQSPSRRHRQVPREATASPHRLKSEDPTALPKVTKIRQDEFWISIEDIKLVTKPTAAPPPSRPPPAPGSKQGYVSKRQVDAKTTVDQDSVTNLNGSSAGRDSAGSSQQQSQRAPESSTKVSYDNSSNTIDELEEFALGGPRAHKDVKGDIASSTSEEEQTEGIAAATASAVAMKEAMERAEAKAKLAKEAKEREREERERERETRAARVRDEREKAREAHEREDKETVLEQGEKERESRAIYEKEEREREEREREARERRRKEREKEKEREREREREKDRIAVERATQEARERAAAEARERAERIAMENRERAAMERENERTAVERATQEARERAATEARERAERIASETRERAERAAVERATAEARDRAAADARERAAERAAVERAASEARARAERAAVERVNAEARARAAERAAAEARDRAERAAGERATAAREQQRRNENDLESFFMSTNARPTSAPRQRPPTADSSSDGRQSSKGFSSDGQRRGSNTAPTVRKVPSTPNIADDWASLLSGTPAPGEFQEVEGESSERRRARWDRHQRTLERAAKALDDKNQRDLQAQRDQAERHRAGETLDVEIKRWAAGKEGNLRALLSTLQYVLWPDCSWQAVSLTDLITAASVKKVYRRATLCVHPDKVQQKGATIQQRYIAEKVFDLLKEAWNKFNSEELF